MVSIGSIGFSLLILMAHTLLKPPEYFVVLFSLFILQHMAVPMHACEPDYDTIDRT